MFSTLTFMQTLLAVGVVFNLIALVLIVVFYFKLTKSAHLAREQADWERKYKSKLSKQLLKKAEGQLTDLLGVYQKSLEQAAGEHFSKMADALSKQAREMALDAQREQKAIAKEMQFLVAQTVLKVEGELSEYKKDKIAKIDEQIKEIVREAAKEILGKSVTDSEQEEQVKAAVEQAKKDHFFK